MGREMGGRGSAGAVPPPGFPARAPARPGGGLESEVANQRGTLSTFHHTQKGRPWGHGETTFLPRGEGQGAGGQARPGRGGYHDTHRPTGQADRAGTVL